MNWKAGLYATIGLLWFAANPAAHAEILLFNDDFNGSTLNPLWQSIGNGSYSVSGGVLRQTAGPRDDNLSILKWNGQLFGDFIIEARFRQDAGPAISSGISIGIRAGDTPGPGANVAGVGPGYQIGWVRTTANYGAPDTFLTKNTGWTQLGPNQYDPANALTLGSATANQFGNWFELGEWHGIRIEAIGQRIKFFHDGVLTLDYVDPSFSAGRLYLNDHFSNTSWDFVRVYSPEPATLSLAIPALLALRRKR